MYRPAIGDLYEEQYFYSAVKSVAVGYPSMSIYGAYILPDYVAEKGYVYPSSSAWHEFDEQYPYFPYRFDNHWNDYLTPERHEALKAQCTTVHECAEGKLYLLDVVGEEFLQYLLDIYATEFVADLQTAVLDEASSTEATYVECDASWGVPGNGYWKYTAAAKKNPAIELTLPKRMMRNYNYKIEITLAPNTEAEETLPSKVSARLCPMLGGTVDLASKFETSVSECSVITLEGVKVNYFTEAGVEIESVMNHSNRGGDVGKFLPILRVAQVKVIPMGPVE